MLEQQEEKSRRIPSKDVHIDVETTGLCQSSMYITVIGIYLSAVEAIGWRCNPFVVFKVSPDWMLCCSNLIEMQGIRYRGVYGYYAP